MGFQRDNYDTIILDANELRTHPCLEDLFVMTNDAFRQHHIELLGPDLPDRFDYIDELVDGLGVHGRACVMFKNWDTNGNNDGQVEPSQKKPVAVAMIKFFKEDMPGLTGSDKIHKVDGGDANHQSEETGARTAKGEPLDILSISDWEPTSIAVKPDVAHRGLGLAKRCLAEVQEDLLSRIEQAELAAATEKSSELTFWIRTMADVNGPYWQRRGYDVVRVKEYPKGHWGAEIPFRLMTLKKGIPRWRQGNS